MEGIPTTTLPWRQLVMVMVIMAMVMEATLDPNAGPADHLILTRYILAGT